LFLEGNVLCSAKHLNACMMKKISILYVHCFFIWHCSVSNFITSGKVQILSIIIAASSRNTAENMIFYWNKFLCKLFYCCQYFSLKPILKFHIYIYILPCMPIWSWEKIWQVLVYEY
jgi:hypothetical protein